MTDLEEKLCRICALAENIINEPTTALWPRSVDQNNVSSYAHLIRDYVLDAMDEPRRF